LQIIDEKNHYQHVEEDDVDQRNLKGFAKITNKLRQVFRAKYFELKEIKQLLYTCSTQRDTLITNLLKEENFKINLKINNENKNTKDLATMFKQHMTMMETRFDHFDSQIGSLKNNIFEEMSTINEKVEGLREEIRGRN
jgi:DNA-binding transcriptional MerR regulator